MKHTLDSNILIGLIQRYPRDIFPNIWHNIEKLAENNAVCICSAVHYETSQADDVLYDWANKLPRFVCPTTNEELQIGKQIGEDHPGWVQGDVFNNRPALYRFGRHSFDFVMRVRVIV